MEGLGEGCSWGFSTLPLGSCFLPEGASLRTPSIIILWESSGGVAGVFGECWGGSSRALRVREQDAAGGSQRCPQGSFSRS